MIWQEQQRQPNLARFEDNKRFVERIDQQVFDLIEEQRAILRGEKQYQPPPNQARIQWLEEVLPQKDEKIMQQQNEIA